jgi:hypothetical protein
MMLRAADDCNTFTTKRLLLLPEGARQQNKNPRPELLS